MAAVATWASTWLPVLATNKATRCPLQPVAKLACKLISRVWRAPFGGPFLTPTRRHPTMRIFALALLLCLAGLSEAGQMPLSVLPGGTVIFKPIQSVRERKFADLVQQ